MKTIKSLIVATLLIPSLSLFAQESHDVTENLSNVPLTQENEEPIMRATHNRTMGRIWIPALNRSDNFAFYWNHPYSLVISKYADELKIPMDRVRLFFGGKEMEPNMLQSNLRGFSYVSLYILISPPRT